MNVKNGWKQSITDRKIIPWEQLARFEQYQNQPTHPMYSFVYVYTFWDQYFRNGIAVRVLTQ